MTPFLLLSTLLAALALALCARTRAGPRRTSRIRPRSAVADGAARRARPSRVLASACWPSSSSPSPAAATPWIGSPRLLPVTPDAPSRRTPRHARIDRRRPGDRRRAAANARSRTRRMPSAVVPMGAPRQIALGRIRPRRCRAIARALALRPKRRRDLLADARRRWTASSRAAAASKASRCNSWSARSPPIPTTHQGARAEGQLSPHAARRPAPRSYCSRGRTRCRRRAARRSDRRVHRAPAARHDARDGGEHVGGAGDGIFRGRAGARGRALTRRRRASSRRPAGHDADVPVPRPGPGCRARLEDASPIPLAPMRVVAVANAHK